MLKYDTVFKKLNRFNEIQKFSSGLSSISLCVHIDKV